VRTENISTKKKKTKKKTKKTKKKRSKTTFQALKKIVFMF